MMDELISEETFRLLINPLYFNQHYKLPKLTDWQSRRALLFEICGEIPDDTIIKMNPNLINLPAILAGKTIDQRKAMIAQSIKKLNEQIYTIGPKINENMRLIPEVATDYAATEQELKSLKLKLVDIEKELTSAGTMMVDYRQKQQDLFSLKNQLENVKSRIYKEANAGKQKLIDERNQLDNRKVQLQYQLKDTERQLQDANKTISENSLIRQEMLEEWRELKSSLANTQALKFVEPDENNDCPTCGQPLPQDMVDGKIDKLRAKFESDKNMKIANLSRSIELNVASGKTTKEETEKLETSINDISATVSELASKLSELEARIAEISIELQNPIATPNYAADSEYVQLSVKIEELQAELEKPIEDTTAEIRANKVEIAAEIEKLNRTLNNKNVADEAKARIEELKQSEKDLSNQKSQLEGQLDLITEFIRAKANTLTDIMNSKFKHVKFELFANQITNNALVECCNTLVNTNGCWVPFSDGNTAGKINAGIDIVNALSEHYGVRVPLWVDNRESITDLAETESQVISLIKPDIRTETDRKKYSKLNIKQEDK